MFGGPERGRPINWPSIGRSGDEMNLHVPQTLEAEVEIMVNSRCANHIVSAQKNAPINGAVQDCLIASYLLTMSWKELEERQMKLLPSPKNKDGTYWTMVKSKIAFRIYHDSKISDERVIDLIDRASKIYPKYVTTKNGIKTFTEFIPGLLFMSILFPANFCYSKKVDFSPEKPSVIIEDGILLPTSAPLCSKTVGGKAQSTLHDLWKRSQELALYFLSDIQQITDRWLPTHGFSIGIQDCFNLNEKKLEEILMETRLKVDDAIKNSLEEPKYKEMEINKLLNDAMAKAADLATKNIAKGERNALNICKNSGAKGSSVNLTQISGFIGQQNVKGKRIPKTLTHETRSLPCFLPNDESPESGGFVFNNYTKGLTPREYFHHSCGGREGVISTAMKTSQTGYAQKRIARLIDDQKTWIDGTVRDAYGRIISFMYGDDGMDAKKLVNVPGLNTPFFVNPINLAKQLNSDARRANEVTKKDKPRKLTEGETEMLLSFIVFNKINSPVIKNVTENARKTLRKIIPSVEIYECKIPSFFVSIRNAYNSSKAPYGMMAGLIATSSIGEPATQMVLNVFHFAGIGSKDACLGVPRFEEIINATKSKDQKHPGCTVYFDYELIQENAKILQKMENAQTDNLEEMESNAAIIKEKKEESLKFLQGLKNDFECTFLEDFLVDWDIKYLPDKVDPENGISPVGLLTYEEYEEEWWVSLSKNTGKVNSESEPESWVIILHFDIQKLFRRRIDLEDIAMAIEFQSSGNFVCICSPNIIGRIEVYASMTEMKTYMEPKLDIPEEVECDRDSLLTSDNIDYYLCREVAIDFLKNVQVSGIPGITKVYPRQDLKTQEYVMDTDGANFLEILSMPGIDTIRTTCDDMHAIKDVLGIRAANRFIFDELTRVVSSDGNYVNPRHIKVLADAMTVSGKLHAASRDGISRDKVGPNAKVMFEKNIDNAVVASGFTESDPMLSLASSVMYGLPGKCGSGFCTIRSTINAK
jgi:DNA-directed RNA polymerase beta' subunit